MENWDGSGDGSAGCTHSFRSARLALQSQNLSSHCWARYASRTPAASGLYRSRPLMMLRISCGRSAGSSPFWFMVSDVIVGVVDEENRLAERLARTFDKPKS